jgi:glycerophosphoryl diester phosphodiesterase
MQTRPLLLGHRGARGEKSIPENTLAAFDFALASGCDGFEFDVRLTVEGKAVICHDATARGLEIAQSTATQLGLPLLREILTRYRRTAFLDIELKVPGLEQITVDLLRQSAPHSAPDRGFVVSSFLPQPLEAMHAIDPAIALGVICESEAQLSRWRDLPVEYVIPHYRLVRENLIAEWKAAGKKIMIWTVNASADMKRFSKWGVDGIISDHPKRLALNLNRRVESRAVSRPRS